MKPDSLNPSEKSARVRTVRLGMDSGLSLNRACAAAGVSPATYLRWARALAAAHGDCFLAFAGKKPTGRPLSVEFSESDQAIARWHRLCKGSLPIAVHFYCLDADASPESVAALRRIEERALETGKEPAWPLSVRRAFEVTEDERNRFRSTKAAQNSEMVTRRGMLWIDENGELHDLLPGELWELDDYSGNQPFSYRDPLTGKIEVGRQILAGMDVCSAGWLGFDLIGRPRDAYRGEDIVRFIARLFRAHGVPRFLRLERGSWESSYIHGLEVEGQAEPWGALDHLCTIQHVWKSKGKGTLEGSFNPLQNWLAHAGRDLGRHAGEFQESAKAWRQVKSAASAPDPRLAGFWSQEQCAAAHEQAAGLMNGRPRERKALAERVSPNDLQSRLGWHTTPLPAAEAWRLLPVKQRRVIRDGHVTINPGGGWPELSFVVNGLDGVNLETGHAVLVACDPMDLAAGAYIANADMSVRNRRGLAYAEMIHATAPAADLAPQIDLSGRRHGTLDLRRQAAAAAATEFRAIRAGAPGRRESAAFDGRGAAARAGNLQPAEPAAAPAPEPRPAPASIAPPVRGGLAAPARGTDAEALLGTDRAARLAALEATAREHL